MLRGAQRLRVDRHRRPVSAAASQIGHRGSAAAAWSNALMREGMSNPRLGKSEARFGPHSRRLDERRTFVQRVRQTATRFAFLPACFTSERSVRLNLDAD
jgi:hypothetical protein